jgi:hypothetical protein
MIYEYSAGRRDGEFNFEEFKQMMVEEGTPLRGDRTPYPKVFDTLSTPVSVGNKRDFACFTTAVATADLPLTS